MVDKIDTQEKADVLSKVFSNRSFVENEDLQHSLKKIIDTTNSKYLADTRIDVLDSYLTSRGEKFERYLGEFVFNGWNCRY